tara:strand:+ start:2861 stop:3127 length:267 start_codon:yes stop_codon:yes gene_type:complete
MFTYDITDVLRKKLKKIGKKDKILAQAFYRKLQEVINRDTADSYKNLKSPLNSFKRIHLTDNYILLFKVEKKHIVFVDVKHWDYVYKK